MQSINLEELPLYPSGLYPSKTILQILSKMLNCLGLHGLILIAFGDLSLLKKSLNYFFNFLVKFMMILLGFFILASSLLRLSSWGVPQLSFWAP
jgi:hypothetical protein